MILKIKIMNEIKEIKLPKGVDSISVTHHDDKIVIEFIPEEPKNGDLAIFWDNDKTYAAIRLYGGRYREYHCDSFGSIWDNAIKFESKEQFEKLLRGEI
jgi:hypothetical protein